MNRSIARPEAWLASELARDTSWVLPMTAAEVAGFDQALAHAQRVGKPLLAMTQADFPLPPESVAVLRRAVDRTQQRWGLCLVKGFPVQRWTEAEVRLAYWGMSLYMGVGRTQNRTSEFINDVRDAGGSYKVKGGRGYNTNAALDFHCDSCDVVALLCRRRAREGGTSKIASSIRIRDELVRRDPSLLPVAQGPFPHSYQGTQDPSQPQWYDCPIIGDHPDYFAMRTNRKNSVAAQRDFPEVPRWTDDQRRLLDTIDEILAAPDIVYSMDLEPGDLQLLNNYVIVHSRTDFVDHDEPDRKRHLLRLWLSVPGSQPLPAAWETYFGDIRPGAVRGGVRGSFMTDEFLAYEARQAAVMDMAYRRWQPAGLKPAGAGPARRDGS